MKVTRLARSVLLAMLGWSGKEVHAAPPTQSSSSVATRAKAETSAYTDTDNVSVLTPSVALDLHDPLAGWAASATYLVDVVSAASVDIVSTASGRWQEVRHAATLRGAYKPYDIGGSVSGAISSEPDYLSLTGGGGVTLDLAKKTVMPALDYSFSHDVAGRTGTPFSVYSLELDRHTLSAHVELLLDRETVINVSTDAVLEIGHQEKPYRYVPMFAPSVAPTITSGLSVDRVNTLRLPVRVEERVLTKRQRFAWSGRLAQRLEDSTFVVSERLYADSWGQKATTTDLKMVFDVSDRLYVWPHLRAHIQSGVSFWRLAYVADPNELSLPRYRTGDRELSPLATGAIGAGAHLNVGSAIDPSRDAFVFQVEGMGTRFSQALFTDQRLALFASTQFEASF